MTQKIIFLKGLPASGKSTWAKEYCKDNPEFIRLNKDDIREELGNPTWSSKFEEQVLSTQRSRGTSALEKGNSIIIDDTNFAEKHSIFWRSIANKLSLEFEERYFDVDVEECIRRDKGREKRVGADVIRKMYKDHVRPISIHTDDRYILEQDPLLPRCIICDLDGTLAIHNGRNPYDENKIHTDKLNTHINGILSNYIFLGTKIIYLSGRNESARMNTENWLRAKHADYINSTLLMRPNKDFRPDEIVKREIYEREIKDKYFVEFVLDDRDKVVKMWREIGLLCLQVYYGDF